MELLTTCGGTEKPGTIAGRDWGTGAFGWRERARMALRWAVPGRYLISKLKLANWDAHPLFYSCQFSCLEIAQGVVIRVYSKGRPQEGIL